MAQLDKARALVTTLRTVKSKAGERQEALTAAYNTLLRHVNVTELRDAIKRCPTGKSGGPSGVSREHFLHMPTEILQRFVPLVNDMLDGRTPEALKRGTMPPSTHPGTVQ